MSDIAEQLHKMADDMIGPYRRLTLEAADEIERLRNERKNCPPASESEYVRRLEDEIERLRTLKSPASRELLNITKGCLDEAEAEIERLRARLDNWVDVNAEAGREIERLRAELGQVREILNDREAEIERMRAENNRHLATEKGPADDLSAGLREAADEIERLRESEEALRQGQNAQRDEIERLRALALKFLFEQTEANADALRAACEVRQ